MMRIVVPRYGKLNTPGRISNEASVWCVALAPRNQASSALHPQRQTPSAWY